MDLSEIIQIGFAGVGGGMLLTGICWIVGLAFSLACNIFSKHH